MDFERKLNKEDREIYICLKPFARFFSKEDFNTLFNGLVLEKNLRQKLNQLVVFQEAGLKTYDDIVNYLEVDSKKKEGNKKNQSSCFYDISSTTVKVAKEIKNGLNASQDDLNIQEKDFIKSKNIPINLYQEIKQKIGRESKNCIKSLILSKIDFSKEEADDFAEFVVKIKKNK